METLQTRGACWSLKEDEARVMEAAVRTAVMSVMKVFNELKDQRFESYRLKLAEAENQNAALRIQLNEAQQELRGLRRVASSSPNEEPISPETTLSFSFGPDLSCCSLVTPGQREEDEDSSGSVCERIAVAPELKEEPLYDSTMCVKTEMMDENCTARCETLFTTHVDHSHLQKVHTQTFDAQDIFTIAGHHDPAFNTIERSTNHIYITVISLKMRFITMS